MRLIVSNIHALTNKLAKHLARIFTNSKHFDSLSVKKQCRISKEVKRYQNQ